MAPNSPAAFDIDLVKIAAGTELVDVPHGDPREPELIATINRPHGVARERPAQGRLPV